MINRSGTDGLHTSTSVQILAWLFSVSFLLTPLYTSAAQQDSGQKLQQIRSDISAIKQNLGSDKKKQQQYQQELRDLEQAIAKLSRQQRQTRQAINKQRQAQQQLSNETSSLRQNLSRQQHNLSQQLRAGYTSGQQQT